MSTFAGRLEVAGGFLMAIAMACNGSVENQTMSDSNAANSQSARVAGRVFMTSDVVGMPEVTASTGTVFAIQSKRWGALSDEIGPDADSPQRAQFGFRREWVDLIEARAEIGVDGRWSLGLDPGDYVLCIGNLAGAAPDPESYPISVQGCLSPRNVSAGNTILDLYVGELGLSGREE